MVLQGAAWAVSRSLFAEPEVVVTPDGHCDAAAGLAKELDDARRSGRILERPFSDRAPLGLPEAYAVQRALTARRTGRGERIVGWKLGYTSLAMREQMGIDEPNYGPLTDAMMLSSGAAVPGGALQPRVEPEIALLLDRRVRPGASIDEVLACCSSAHACLEVVDSIWAGYRFTIEDNTADGSSAGFVVLGAELPFDDLAHIAVELSVDGRAVASATGAAANGHPARGVCWLAEQLATDERGLTPGDVVITGGLTRAVPILPGNAITATFSSAWPPVTVACHR